MTRRSLLLKGLARLLVLLLLLVHASSARPTKDEESQGTRGAMNMKSEVDAIADSFVVAGHDFSLHPVRRHRHRRHRNWSKLPFVAYPPFSRLKRPLSPDYLLQ
ncbi:hypothetical protein AAVH_08461 [Aphelenchoides avenae]|nr:hypothetical protein AAVH_08461 [Aphelenchus avenae]